MQSVLMEQPINRETLNELEETVAGGISEIIIDLIDTYVSDSQQTLDKLSNALATNHLKEVERHAHSLKSSSATFGAEALAALSAQMEHLARIGDVEPIATLAAEAQTQFTRVAHVLLEERSRLL